MPLVVRRLDPGDAPTVPRRWSVRRGDPTPPPWSSPASLGAGRRASQGGCGRGASPSHVEESRFDPGVDEPRSRARCDGSATPPRTDFSSMPSAVTSSRRPGSRPRACR